MPEINVAVGSGAVKRLPQFLRGFKSSRLLLIAEKKAFGLHGKTVGDILTHAGFEFVFIPFAGGEKNKTLAEAESIYHRMLDSRITRRTPILAMGGGVTTDLTGFAASTFMRGVPLFLIPTTLLAQVDAAIGGKTGVNLKEGKNLIGTFYFPEATIVDPQFLQTLPPRELRGGFAEIIKMSILEGERFFGELEQLTESGLSASHDLEPLIKRAIDGKIQIVKKDPYESSDERALLNLGHTFAHALEAATSYRRYTHGEAVAIGLVAACRLAEEVIDFSNKVSERVKKILLSCKLPIRYSHTDSKTLLACMFADKKKTTGLRFVLPARLGHVIVKEGIPEGKILKVLEELKEQ